MRLSALVLVAGLGAIPAAPAFAATFAELVAWCAPEDAGGRPGLCSGYLETYLPALASSDASLNDGVRACVPETTDRAEILALIQAYATQASRSRRANSGVGGLGHALKDRYPCPG